MDMILIRLLLDYLDAEFYRYAQVDLLELELLIVIRLPFSPSPTTINPRNLAEVLP
ncbi:hypothetical protein MOMUL_29740 [Moorella mulderi DSM 14980]|uniref:Uncharacterized protein n=1 Tax=Moorella mulderi DSM 14980 TaxID=1122241 RepID=A0A151ASX5_9FIRM|nr:hypothetical protein MOMUL_29740 [Moorella mulderi DSM 14980]